ncbi:MAG: glycosyltransferase family 2 protein [Anaerolineales bacterium]
MNTEKKKFRVDLVVPIFNEAGVVEHTHKRICDSVDLLPYDIHFIYVDDGSSDGTADTIRKIATTDKRVTLLQLSRNFGHQAALTAGLDASLGDVVISLDGDGQHPPEVIPQMIEYINQGFDIVQGQRAEASDPSLFKNLTSKVFYRLLNIVSGTTVLPGAADFRAMSRQAVEGLKSMPEYHRFLRGMVSWMGYKAVILPYKETNRIAGKSKYSLGKMIRLASDAIFSFSLTPLYIGLSVGLLFFILAFVQIIYVSNLWLTGQFDRIVPGWSSLMAIILIASGTIMILLGFIGVYIGYIFQEIKHRPVYLIQGERKDEQ